MFDFLRSNQREEKAYGRAKRMRILKTIEDKIAEAQLELAKVNGKRAEMYQKVLNEALELDDLGYDPGLKLPSNKNFSGDITDVIVGLVEGIELPKPIKNGIIAYIKKHPELAATAEGYLNKIIEERTKGLNSDKNKLTAWWEISKAPGF